MNPFKTLILGTAAMATLSACVGLDSNKPLMERNTIQVAESIERLELYPNNGTMQLSPRDQHAMAAFLASYRKQGNGPIYLNAPQNAGPGIGIAQNQVRTAMGALGLSGVPVQEGNYPAQFGAPAPLVVSYRRLKTLIPRCDGGGENLVSTYHNTPSANWGCAHYANIAAMVADPNQFLEPYAITPRTLDRGVVIYEKYIKGEATGAERPADQSISSQESGGGL